MENTRKIFAGLRPSVGLDMRNTWTSGRSFLVGLIGLLCLAFGSVELAAQTSAWKQSRADAVAAYRAGDYAAAEQHLLKAIEHAEKFGTRDPRLAATLNDLALTNFRQGKYAEAEPLHRRALEIRETSDGGRPIVVSRPDSPNALVYRAIADRVWEKIAQSLGAPARQMPKIVMQ